jgi:alkaline phosphatase D
MPLDNARRDFIRNSATLLTAASATGLLSACGSSHDRPAQADYLYGVASGDPLTDRVILWTHARAGNLDTAIALSWQVASDAEFRQIVSAGQVSATADTGFTAKVDASGLTRATVTTTASLTPPAKPRRSASPAPCPRRTSAA